MASDEGEQAVAGFGESGESFERLKRRGEPAAVALTRPFVERLSAGAGRIQPRRSGLLALVILSSVFEGPRCVLAFVGSASRASAPPCRLLVHRQTSAKLEPNARSIRASVSSRPSRATVSKIPGETARPASATRSGWYTALRLEPRGARSRRRAPPRSPRHRTARRATRGLRERHRERRAPARRATSRAPRIVVARAVEDESAERPEVGQRLQLLGADRRRSGPSPARP